MIIKIISNEKKVASIEEKTEQLKVVSHFGGNINWYNQTLPKKCWKCVLKLNICIVSHCDVVLFLHGV